MGGCLGVLFKGFLMKEFIYNEDIEGQALKYKELFDDIDFIKEDLDIFYTAFWNIDLNGSNFIKREEILSYFGIKQLKINLHLINVFEDLEHKNNRLNFAEFVISMWNMLSSNQNEIFSKAFYFISGNKEDATTLAIKNCIIELHDSKNIDSIPNLKKCIKAIETTTNMLQMNKKQFITLCNENKNFMEPLFVNVLYKLKLRVSIII
jgi:hypothetical protein